MSKIPPKLNIAFLSLTMIIMPILSSLAQVEEAIDTEQTPAIYISPDIENFFDTETLIVDIMAEPAGTPVNLAYVNLSYPPDKVILQSVNYADSFCELQILEQVDNEAGNLFIACGTTSREIATTSPIASLYFEKINTGMADFNFNDAGLLAADGYGTSLDIAAENHRIEIVK